MRIPQGAQNCSRSVSANHPADPIHISSNSGFESTVMMDSLTALAPLQLHLSSFLHSHFRDDYDGGSAPLRKSHCFIHDNAILSQPQRLVEGG